MAKTVARRLGTEERELNKRMMMDDNRWPQLVLPIKRYVKHEAGGNAMENAYLTRRVVDETVEVAISVGNMFAMSESDPTKVYENVEKLLDDGWVVD